MSHSYNQTLTSSQVFYDRMTVYRNRFLANTTNRCTEFKFYWFTTLHVSGSLSAHHQEFLAVHRLFFASVQAVMACVAQMMTF